MKHQRGPGALHGIIAGLTFVSALGVACSSGSDQPAGSESPSSAATGELTVLAAASLTEAFTEIGRRFEASNEGVEVSFSFGPSDGLATQINNGSPTDVFASASATWMDAVQDDGPGVTDRADFVRNKLVVITPADNPAGIGSIEDLGDPGLKLVLAAEDVPVGTYAREALANAGIADEAEANVVSNEEDVKAVVQKVLLGEADAGIVYVTDVTEDVAPDIHPIEIAKNENVIATYPIAVVADTEHAETAAAFVEFVTGSDGQGILRAAGFLAP